MNELLLACFALNFLTCTYVGRSVTSWIRPRVRDLALRSSEEIVAFTATMSIKRCERQLLEKCWSVCESRTTFKVDMPWLWKKENGTNHGTFTTKIVKSVFILLATRGHDILYSDWGEKILHRSVHHIELTFVYCALKRTCYFCTVNYRCFNYCQ